MEIMLDPLVDRLHSRAARVNFDLGYLVCILLDRPCRNGGRSAKLTFLNAM